MNRDYGFNNQEVDIEEDEYVETPVNDKLLNTIVNTIIKTVPGIKQIIFDKGGNFSICTNSLVIIIDSDRLQEDDNKLRDYVTKLSGYNITSYVFSTREKLPVKILCSIIGGKCKILYGEGYRKYFATKEIVNYAVEEANRRLERAEELFEERYNKEQMYRTPFDMGNYTATRISNAIGELSQAIELPYCVYMACINDGRKESEYQNIKYYAGRKFCSINLYTISELEAAYKNTKQHVKNLNNTITEQLIKLSL